MLEQIAKHGGFSLQVKCEGDLEVDEHHTVEDTAICLGTAIRQALGNKRGIGRYGFLLPMDESESKVSLDLSGRAFFDFKGEFPRERIGSLPTELVKHFFHTLSDSLGAALHIDVSGENTHHMVEACFKSVGRSLRQAIRLEGSALPSTKGTLS
jgi:imidazoleglycerol-phosphate dehydratase/histidinol-phosphatase